MNVSDLEQLGFAHSSPTPSVNIWAIGDLAFVRTAIGAEWMYQGVHIDDYPKTIDEVRTLITSTGGSDGKVDYR